LGEGKRRRGKDKGGESRRGEAKEGEGKGGRREELHRLHKNLPSATGNTDSV